MNKRKLLRIHGHDYAEPGYYFVTICTYGRDNIFGIIEHGKIILNDIGRMVEEEWIHTNDIREWFKTDTFVIMPNHFHGIIEIMERYPIVGANGRSPLQQMQPKSLSSCIAGYKSATTKRINVHRNTPKQPVWQRNYYEHVIRDETDLDRVREYIRLNPGQWEYDRENPENNVGVNGR
ncbi:transposase [Patescibacteria group bacterium]|nr:transposase [Patescibacteria group bacterium]MBU1906959.1 transposase [Patescibacteria group bacterium]